MPTTITGSTGVSQIQDGAVSSTAKLGDGVVTPAKTQVGALPSMVRLNTANGYGSTNTMIRRFTNTVANQGTDITYADSATLGASFTINAAGVYAISYCDSFTGANSLGISLNSVQLTTQINAVAVGSRLSFQTASGANASASTSWVGYLAAGDVLRAHTDGVASGLNLAQFTIARVA